MMRISSAMLTCLALSLAGCFGGLGHPMTPMEIAMNGLHKFNAPPSKVFDATVAALSSEGYDIAIANKERGLIKTRRKLVATNAQGAYGYATAVEVTRQYTIRITADGEGSSVEAVPSVFQGDADLSSGDVWMLDGPAGERTLWKRLFQAIEESL